MKIISQKCINEVLLSKWYQMLMFVFLINKGVHSLLMIYFMMRSSRC
jgi:hypothetical protein